MRRPVPALAIGLLFSCGTAQTRPSANDPANDPVSATALRTDGELAFDDQLYTKPGEGISRRADLYQMSWPQAVPVRIWVSSPTLAEADLSLDAPGTAKPAFSSFTAQPGQRYDIVVMGGGASTEGAYQLIVDPPPDLFRAPLRNNAEGRRSRVMAAREGLEFSRTAADLSKVVKTSLQRFNKEGEALHSTLEQLQSIDLPVDSDHCYQLVLKLEKNAAFSDVARRGVRGRLATDETHTLAFNIIGPGGITQGELCPRDAQKATFSIAAKAYGLERELGTGPVSIELWSRIATPFAESVATRDRAIAKYTKGLTGGETRSVKLETLASLDAPVSKGECLVAVLRLGKGAQFSSDLRKTGLSIDLNTPGLSISGGPGVVGPGAVASFGCMQTGSKAKLVFGYAKQSLGSGPATLQLYTRIASDGELHKLAADDRGDRREQDLNFARIKSEACQSCVEEKISCRKRGAIDCDNSFYTCVRSKGYRESECGG